MTHAAMVISSHPYDGTPREMADAAIRFFSERMPVLLTLSPFDHQGNPFPTDPPLSVPADPHPNLHVQCVPAASEWDHRNVAFATIRAVWPTVRWVWIVDTDEFYSEADFETIRLAVESDGESAAWFTVRRAYWKGLNWRIHPIERHHSLVVVETKKTHAFVHIRTAAGMSGSRLALVPNAVQHHLTAVRSDEQMKVKWDHFSHAHQLLPRWYEEKWLGWYPEMEDLHPTEAHLWKKAVPCAIGDLPESLQPLYKAFAYEPETVQKGL